MNMNLAYVWKPNRVVSSAVLRGLGLAWTLVLVAAWSTTSFDVLPTPLEVVRARFGVEPPPRPDDGHHIYW